MVMGLLLSTANLHWILNKRQALYVHYLMLSLYLLVPFYEEMKVHRCKAFCPRSHRYWWWKLGLNTGSLPQNCTPNHRSARPQAIGFPSLSALLQAASLIFHWRCQLIPWPAVAGEGHPPTHTPGTFNSLLHSRKNSGSFRPEDVGPVSRKWSESLGNTMLRWYNLGQVKKSEFGPKL